MNTLLRFNLLDNRTSRTLPCCLLAGLLIAGLTACGGSTTTKAPVPAAASDSGSPVTGTTDNPVRPNRDIITDHAGTGDTELVVVPEQSTGAIAPPDSQALPGYEVNQAVLNAAANVSCEASAEQFRTTMLELINASRSESRFCGAGERDAVGVLRWNDTLTQTAEIHARDMLTNNFFSHDGSDGLSVSDRATAAGYPWRAIGENIAAGQTNHAQVHQGWLDSESHCRNIMNGSYTEVGSACLRDPNTDFGTYWVVVFGDSK